MSAVTSVSPHPSAIPWMPQPGPQTEAIRKHTIDEILFGGGVGGGKSDYLLGDFGQDVPNYGGHWHGILFRNTYSELDELIKRALEIYPDWFPGCEWLKSDSEWHWPNGATLKLRYMESAADWQRYWGHQYSWIGWDELGNFQNLQAYHKMKARLRSAVAIPNKRMRASANPGGPSHSEVKQYFGIDRYPMGGQIIVDEASGMRRMFIRSRLSDNKILLKADPGYARRLQGLGSPLLVRAWLDGDWSVVQGAYFPEFSTERHVVAPVTLPDYWTRLRAIDWGSSRPFYVGWFAVSDGSLPQFAKDALVNYREWYGSNGQPNVGLKLTAEEVARGILDREDKGERIDDSVIDPSAFAQNGGPSIAESMMAVDSRLVLRRADNTRVARQGAIGGWDQVRARLKGEDGRPMLSIFSTCTELIRTLPALQHDGTRPEDVDSGSEDHAPDGLRYACLSRPYLTEAPDADAPVWPPRMGDLTKAHFAARRRERAEAS